jgi:hypothetical protein
MAPLLATALLIIPEDVPHTRGGALFGDLLIRPVPRQLWAGKPVEPRRRIIQTLWPGQFHLRPEFSVLLYPYLDFGLMGVAIALAAFGVAVRTLYQYYLRYSQVFGAQLLFAVALPFIVIAARDSPVDTLARAAFVILPLWFILSLGSRRRVRH